MVEEMSRVSLIGSPETVKDQLQDLKSRVEFDEIMVNSYIYDPKAQAYSYQLLAEVVKSLA